MAEAPSLDITGNDPLNQHGSGGGPMSLREALVGLIEEYARHMGHADLLRERIDGYRPVTHPANYPTSRPRLPTGPRGYSIVTASYMS